MTEQPKPTVYTSRWEALDAWIDGGMQGRLWHHPIADESGEPVFIDLWCIADTVAQFRNAVRDFLVPPDIKPLTRDEAHREIRDDRRRMAEELAEELAGEEA